MIILPPTSADMQPKEEPVEEAPAKKDSDYEIGEEQQENEGEVKLAGD